MRRVTDEELDAAREVIRRAYRQEIRALADELLAAVRADRTLDRELLVRRALDHHSWVIFTWRAQLVIAVSENDSAWEELEQRPDDSVRAAHAMRADLERLLDTEPEWSDEWDGETEDSPDDD